MLTAIVHQLESASYSSTQMEHWSVEVFEDGTRVLHTSASSRMRGYAEVNSWIATRFIRLDDSSTQIRKKRIMYVNIQQAFDALNDKVRKNLRELNVWYTQRNIKYVYTIAWTSSETGYLMLNDTMFQSFSDINMLNRFMEDAVFYLIGTEYRNE